MTVNYLGDIPEEQRSSSDGTITKHTVYSRFLTEVTDSAYAVWSHISSPKIGQIHYQDPNARCRDRGVVEVQGVSDLNDGRRRLQWKIFGNYDTETNLIENPLNEPAEIWWTGEKFQREVFRNRNNEVIQNTIGYPVKGNFIDDSRPVANISKNVDINIPTWFFDVPDVLNNASFTFEGASIARNNAKYSFISMSKVSRRNNIPFKVLQFQLHFRKDQWKLYYPNEGYYQKDLATGEHYKCIDATGAQVTQPAPLNLSGEQIFNPGATSVITLEEDAYEEYDFSTLQPYWT